MGSFNSLLGKHKSASCRADNGFVLAVDETMVRSVSDSVYPAGHASAGSALVIAGLSVSGAFLEAQILEEDSGGVALPYFLYTFEGQPSVDANGLETGQRLYNGERLPIGYPNSESAASDLASNNLPNLRIIAPPNVSGTITGRICTYDSNKSIAVVSDRIPPTVELISPITGDTSPVTPPTGGTTSDTEAPTVTLITPIA